MKKYFTILVLLVAGVFALLGQQPADTTAVNVVTGGTLAEFFKNNLWVLIFIAYSILEAWFGQTNWIKEGSVLAFIWNWIGRIIKKQIPSVKGKFMSDEKIKAVRGLKMIALLVMFSALSLGAYSQSRWDGFFEKKQGTKVELLKGEGDQSYNWFVRPAAQLTAIKLEYDAEKKIFNPGEFSAAGIGLGYQHYAEHNGELVNDYGVNALLIINGSEASNQAGFGVAATVNALGFVNVGGGRDFVNDKWLILMGASWSF